MQLTLNYVHLVNFRVHEDYMFKPSSNGITAILGSNGHGKSSIIDGISWALYGTKPNKTLKASELKRNTASEKDPCSVEVSLTLNGDSDLRVIRFLKGKTVQCECYLNGVLEAGPAVSNASKWIVKTLNLDEEGFLSAILVQQKQVDNIISQTAAVRQASIEKLTGITAATLAVKEARENALTFKKALAMIAPDTQMKEKYEKIIKDTNNDLNKVQQKRAILKESFEKKLSEYNTVDSEYNTLYDSKKRKDELENEVNTLKSNIKLLKEQQDSLTDKVLEEKANLPEQISLDEYSSQLKVKEQELYDYQSKEAELNNIISRKPSDNTVNDLKNNISNLQKTIDDDSDVEELEKNVNIIQNNISDVKAKISQAEKSLNILKSDNDELSKKTVKCPTCLQNIKDPAHIISEFEKQISENSELKDKYLNDLNEAKQLFDNTVNNINRLEDSKKTLQQYENDLTDAKTAEAELEKVEAEIKNVSDEIKALRTEISNINVNNFKIEQCRKDSEQLMQVNEIYGEKAEALKVKETEVKKFTNVSEAALKTLENKRQRMSDEINNDKLKAVDLKGQVSILQERLTNAEDGLKKAEEEENARKKALKQHEIAQASVSVLSSFREHLAKEVVPKITDYASDLTNAITDGLFTSVNMDEKYNITVTDSNNNIMSVHSLSGGEQSVVAISLRLAISEMLADGNTTLILDEVLTAMDDVRAQKILEVIQNAGHNQVIIIAHNDIVKSIADSVVQL